MSDMSGNDDRLRITEEDIATPEIDLRVESMNQARQVALVRTVGDVPTSTGSTTLRAILTLVGGGAIGGLLAFGASKLTNPLTENSDSAFWSNMIFSFELAFFIGSAIALADVAMNKNWAKIGKVALWVLPAVAVAGFVFGLIANFFYSNAVDGIYTSAFEQVFAGDMTADQAEAYITTRLHPVRGIAWMLVGISAGIAAGAASRSWKRLGLAAAGGAVGGFLGGFIFDFIGSEAAAQIVGIVVLGILIGLAMALLEQATKSRWIEITAGGLAGKQFILYKNEITLGSAPEADITLIKDSAIPPIAAILRVRGSACEIEAAPSLAELVVNGNQQRYSSLRDHDVVTIGHTQIRFRERASASKVPGALQR